MLFFFNWRFLPVSDTCRAERLTGRSDRPRSSFSWRTPKKTTERKLRVHNGDLGHAQSRRVTRVLPWTPCVREQIAVEQRKRRRRQTGIRPVEILSDNSICSAARASRSPRAGLAVAPRGGGGGGGGVGVGGGGGSWRPSTRASGASAFFFSPPYLYFVVASPAAPLPPPVEATFPPPRVVNFTLRGE